MNRILDRRTPARVVASTAAAVLAVGLTATAAQASSTTKSDPRDDAVNGETSVVDLARISMRTKGRHKIEVTYRMHEPVALDALGYPGGMAVEFQKNRNTLRSVRVFVKDGTVRGTVCSYDQRQQVPTPTGCSKIDASQVDDRTFRAVVKRDKVKKGATVLKWYASTLDASGGTFTVDVLGRGAAGRPNTWRVGR